MPRIVHLTVASYSGATTLNALLDTQPEIRGIGETIWRVKRNERVWCPTCNGPMVDCHMAAMIGAPDLWERLAAIYPDAAVLFSVTKMPIPHRLGVPDTPAGMVESHLLLYKLPHEFAYSWHKHESATPEKGLDEWATFHRAVAKQYDLLRRLEPRRYDTLSYRDMALKTHASVLRLCLRWGVPYSRAAVDALWTRRPTTCMPGGNNAVFAQNIQNAPFLNNPEFADGKYVGKLGKIFLDEIWRADDDFKRACEAYYKEPVKRALIDTLAGRLGLPFTTASLLDDLAGRSDAG